MSTNNQTPGTGESKSKGKKLLLWIGGGIVGLFAVIMIIGAIGLSNEPGGFDAAVESMQAEESAQAEEEAEAAEATPSSDNASTEPTAAPTTPADETEGSAPADTNSSESKEEFADRISEAYLDGAGEASYAAILNRDSTLILGYTNGVESPSAGTVILTVQLTETEVVEEELDKAATAFMNIAGYAEDDLDRVEIVTSDSSVRGVANRHDNALLNQ
ncbi:hypothetical protein [Zhihengliuella flava]|uniref:Uncharacterized protein n=1 Tax=Zhihengliuella flava TaxID=1285193 RepID=A0A931GK86_9MICC|nr:hypothetical protein [Zhihengliuella flava]MBG6083284.1 hypothetical protein [Zhihengliuella flava]